VAVTTGSFGKALWPGVQKYYSQAYNPSDPAANLRFEIEMDIEVIAKHMLILAELNETAQDSSLSQAKSTYNLQEEFEAFYEKT
jgi:hypothetical protein